VLLVTAPALGQSTARFDDMPGRPAAVPIQTLASFDSWATRRARNYVERAQSHTRRGDVALALQAYSEAIRVDGSHGPAYLGLAWLREGLGDFGEAERLYAAASRLAPVAPEAYARRARLRSKLGRGQEALRDLEAAVRLDPESPARARELAAGYAERQAWPAALALWRRVLAGAEEDGNAREIAEARVQVQALSLLAGESDPVVGAARAHPNWVRRSIRSTAQRSAR
jgi:tetratricopeptide (TPR) repeat protein